MANRKTLMLSGKEYEFNDCTAIAASVGDTIRQKAVLVYQVGGDLSLIFGCTVDDLPNSPEEMERFLMEEPVSSDWEDVKTVLLDGKPLNEFVLG